MKDYMESIKIMEKLDRGLISISSTCLYNNAAVRTTFKEAIECIKAVQSAGEVIRTEIFNSHPSDCKCGGCKQKFSKDFIVGHLKPIVAKLKQDIAKLKQDIKEYKELDVLTGNELTDELRKNDDLQASLKVAQDEVANIKHIANDIDEFGRPIQSDGQLLDLAERIYGQFAEVYEEKDTLTKEIAEIKERASTLFEALKKLVERVDMNGGIGEYKGGPPFVMKSAREAISEYINKGER